MTKQAIREGFEKLRPGEQLQPLESAARARSEADWLVGMNATRAATIRGRAWVGGVVSLGRVQTPTLAIIVSREREIQAFVPEPYWLVHASFDPRYEGLWFDPLKADDKDTPTGQETWLKEAERAEEIVTKVSGKTGTVESVERKEQSERAPLLYDLTSLQRDANRRFGFSARRTLQAAQSLYEGKKAITYPRTNSRYLSGDLVPQLKPTAETLVDIPEYAAAAPLRPAARASCRSAASSTTRRSTTTTRSSRPTSSTTSSEFSPDERRIFDLVARRFLAVFHPPARYARTTSSRSSRRSASAPAARSRSRPGGAASTASRPTHGKTRRRTRRAPSCRRSRRARPVKVVSAESEAKETRPPPRYTEATLLSAMETAGKLDRRRGAPRGDEGARPRHSRPRAPRRSRRSSAASTSSASARTSCRPRRASR